MNLPETQASILNEKIDVLHQMIEQLSDRLSLLLSDLQTSTPPPSRPYGLHHGNGQHHPGRAISSFDEEMMEHKDVLHETSYFESDRTSGDHILTSEVQVQRLTAQLTAAYNRIAALEEQLLAYRIH